MNRKIAAAAAIVCALQPSVAAAADAAICEPLGTGQSSIGIYQASSVFTALALDHGSVNLAIFPLKGSCFAENIAFKTAKGSVGVLFDTMGNCGTNNIPANWWLNKSIRGGPVYQGTVQADGSTVYIGRIFVTSPAPMSSYDFKLVYKAPYFTSACIANVDASRVSVLWNGR